MKRKKTENKKTMFLILALAGLLSVVVFIGDNSGSLPRDEQGFELLKRKEHGKGTTDTELEAEIDGAGEKMTIQVHEQEYTKEEILRMFADTEEQLEKRILNGNQSLDEVRSNLDLCKEIPELGVKINWESDRYDVISQDGTIHNTDIEEDGVIVKLKAVLTCQEEKEEYGFSVRILPPKYSAKEVLLQSLATEVEKYDEQSKTKSYQMLPKQIGDRKVSWHYVTDYRAFGIFLLGATVAVLLYYSEKQKKQDEEEKRIKELSRQYPQLISKFTLYLGAGMTVRTAWFRMASEYENGRQEKGRKEAYEEMLLTMYEIKGGTSESEAYEHFGERCRMASYRKFAVLLSQNLKKGTKGLNALLRQESENAFEERKNAAKKLGEEAGTKMLFPMFLMLGVVLVMIVIPAFFSLQLS